jgi:hypothetical protein
MFHGIPVFTQMQDEVLFLNLVLKRVRSSSIPLIFKEAQHFES